VKNKKLGFLFIYILVYQFLSANERRIGKLDTVNLDSYFKLGSNSYPYSESMTYPNLSSVGAVVSEDLYGTGTLIASNVVMTAAHVLKNTLFDPTPNPASWEFILHTDYENASNEQKYTVQSIQLHPGWDKRLSQKNGLGDGDELGVDIALVFLKNPCGWGIPSKTSHRRNRSCGESNCSCRLWNNGGWSFWCD
jgi:hypothetical protein